MPLRHQDAVEDALGMKRLGVLSNPVLGAINDRGAMVVPMLLFSVLGLRFQKGAMNMTL